MRRTLLLIGLALLAGCSSSGTTAKPMTPQAVAGKIHCDGYADKPAEQLFVQRMGECTLSGDTVQVYTFASDDLRDQWLKIARGFGGTYAVSSRVVVTGDSATSVDAAASSLGVSAS